MKISRIVGRIISPRDEHYRSNGLTSPVCGMRNLGNTCYINAVIQSLANTPQIKEYCHLNPEDVSGKAGDKNTYNGSLRMAFSTLVNALWSKEYKVVTPLALKDIVSEAHTQFRGTDQNDAHEFLLILLDMLSSESQDSYRQTTSIPNPIVYNIYDNQLTDEQFITNRKRVRDEDLQNDPITSTFQGRIEKQTLCLFCKNSVCVSEQFFCLSVPLVKETIDECVDACFQTEIIKDWRCEKCGRCGDAVIQSKVLCLPPVLILHMIYIDDKHSWKKCVTHLQSQKLVKKYELFSCIVC